MTFEEQYMELQGTTRVVYKQEAIKTLNETYECGVLQEISDEATRRFRQRLCTGSDWIPVYLGEETRVGLFCCECGDLHRIEVTDTELFFPSGVGGLWDVKTQPLVKLEAAGFRTHLSPQSMERQHTLSARLSGQEFRVSLVEDSIHASDTRSHLENELKLRLAEELSQHLFNMWFGATESVHWIVRVVSEMGRMGVTPLGKHPQVQNLWNRHQRWMACSGAIVDQIRPLRM